MPTLLTAAGLYLVWTRFLWPLIRAFFKLFVIVLLIPVAAVLWLSRHVRVETPAKPRPMPPKPVAARDRAMPPTDEQSPPQGTGDWRQDKELLRRLLAEGKIK